MPVPEVEALDKNSSDAQIKAARSACIATEIRSGRDPKQAEAMCYSMVDKKTGKNEAQPNPQGGA
jgi:hypothetical protein